MPALLAAVMLIVAFPVWADPPLGAGLDLLLLVDRSGSMAPHAPAIMVDALPLALNVLGWSSRHARVTHRFGIVSFGSHAQVDVPLTAVETQTLSLLRNRIGALRSTSLGHTNLAEAFETAAAVFRSRPAGPLRRRAILLITDGHPDVPGAPAARAWSHADHVVDTALARHGISVDVLLFGRQEIRGAGIARQRIHRVENNRADLLAVLHRVTSELAGVRSTQQTLSAPTEALVLPPYLDLVVFDIVHGDSVRGVEVLPPGSAVPVTTRTPGVEEAHQGERMSTIVVRRPAAGAWVFRKVNPAARVRVLSQQFFPRGTLVHPPSTPAVRQHDELRIAYRLDDGAGRPLQELPGYPLSVDLSLAMPDGERVTRPMARDGESRYRAEPTTCSVTGRYWTEVLVTTADSEGRPVRVLEDLWAGFTVHEAAAEVRTAEATLSGRDSDDGRSWTDERSLRPWAVVMATASLLALLLLATRRR